MAAVPGGRFRGVWVQVLSAWNLQRKFVNAGAKGFLASGYRVLGFRI